MLNTVTPASDFAARQAATAEATIPPSLTVARAVIYVRDLFARIAAVNVWVAT